jgi:peptidyl-prolyl cis-trans isomerase SurA
MRAQTTIRTVFIAAGMACACLCPAARAQQQPQVLDRVEAVVSNQAILSSDIENELRLSVLDPDRGRRRPLTARRALQLLISRALIQQQIKQTYIQIAEPSDEDVQARMKDLRTQLPLCAQKNCATPAGWAAFLQENSLTEAEVANYIRLRLEMLAFIEARFRQGIQIPRDQVEKYYKETLLPEYPKNEKAPPLETVAPRIEEILLEQQVNTLFSTWLRDLRKQGDVEILDRALEPAATDTDASGEDSQ